MTKLSPGNLFDEWRILPDGRWAMGEEGDSGAIVCIVGSSEGEGIVATLGLAKPEGADTHWFMTRSNFETAHQGMSWCEGVLMGMPIDFEQMLEEHHLSPGNKPDPLSGLKDKLYWRQHKDRGPWHCFKRIQSDAKEWQSLCGHYFKVGRIGGGECKRPNAWLRCGICDGLEMERRGWTESGPASKKD